MHTEAVLWYIPFVLTSWCSVAAVNTAELRLDGESYVGAQTTLPCYMETFKTYDKQNYYKSGDIAQVPSPFTARREKTDSSRVRWLSSQAKKAVKRPSRSAIRRLHYATRLTI